jgi:hypothetical protein
VVGSLIRYVSRSKRTCHSKFACYGLLRIAVMIIAYSTRPLRELCESQSKAERQLGVSVAAALRDRLSEMRAADNVAELPVGSPTALNGTADAQFTLKLNDGHVLRLKVNHNKVPTTANGEVDWARVSRVQLLAVENTHG